MIKPRTDDNGPPWGGLTAGTARRAGQVAQGARTGVQGLTTHAPGGAHLAPGQPGTTQRTIRGATKTAEGTDGGRGREVGSQLQGADEGAV